jgi:hypothetical protein
MKFIKKKLNFIHELSGMFIVIVGYCLIQFFEFLLCLISGEKLEDDAFVKEQYKILEELAVEIENHINDIQNKELKCGIKFLR